MRLAHLKCVPDVVFSRYEAVIAKPGEFKLEDTGEVIQVEIWRVTDHEVCDILPEGPGPRIGTDNIWLVELRESLGEELDGMDRIEQHAGTEETKVA